MIPSVLQFKSMRNGGRLCVRVDLVQWIEADNSKGTRIYLEGRKESVWVDESVEFVQAEWLAELNAAVQHAMGLQQRAMMGANGARRG